MIASISTVAFIVFAENFKSPVGHDDDRFTLSNEEFGLFVSAPTLEGIAGISDEVAQLRITS